MKLLFLLIAAAIATSARCQPASITGTIRVAGGQPLSYCYVSLLKQDSSIAGGTLTDSMGVYEFAHIAAGSYFIAAESVGYPKQYSNTVSVSPGVFSIPYLLMRPDTNQLGGVTVISRKKLYEMQSDKLVVNVENSILATGNSAFELLRRSPSVSVGKDDRILLRGSPCSIYIDGKPFYLKGGELTEYLKTLQADAISKIEIISNPSSRFDAEGIAGIINIRLKKNKNYGLNGTANAGMGYGIYPKENGGINLNYRRGRINVFGNGAAGHSESYNRLTYNTVIDNNGAISYQYRNQYWHPFTRWGNCTAGADYNVGKSAVVGLVVSNKAERTTAQTDNSTNVADALQHTGQHISVLRSDTSHNTNTDFALNFKKQIDSAGSELTADAGYTTYTGTSQSINANNFYDAGYNTVRAPYIFRNNQPLSISVRSVKADLTYYLPGGAKIETGGKYSNVVTDNNLIADSLAAGYWTADNSRSNHFVYSEDIYAAYITGSKTFNKTSVQAGLRAEQTHSTGTSLTLHTAQPQHYVNLFPTLFITQTLNDRHQLNFSYTRRIERPQYQSLNPFTVYVDPFTVFAGNPYLKPSYTNSLELKHGYKDMLFTSLSYNHTTNDQVTAVIQDKATGVTTNINRNATSSDFLFMSVTASLTVTKAWSCDVTTNFSCGRNYSAIPA